MHKGEQIITKDIELLKWVVVFLCLEIAEHRKINTTQEVYREFERKAKEFKEFKGSREIEAPEAR